MGPALDPISVPYWCWTREREHGFTRITDIRGNGEAFQHPLRCPSMP
jgi:hypothetical protein